MWARYLKRTQPMMYGPAVRRWQEILNALGVPVSVDGWFGEETHNATLRAQGILGVAEDGIVGDQTFSAARSYLNNVSDDHTLTILDEVEVCDYRDRIPPPSNGGGRRLWSEISGVMLHRTGCVIGENPNHWRHVNAHVGITLGGKLLLLQPWDMMIWHGHKPSPWTIGVEIDGNPEGYPGYHWTPGGGPHICTGEQVRAAMLLAEMLHAAFVDNHVQWKYLLAHRQASDQRECDPGWQVWQKIALPIMDKYHLSPTQNTGWAEKDNSWRQGSVWNTGFKIPQSWDPQSPISGFRER